MTSDGTSRSQDGAWLAGHQFRVITRTAEVNWLRASVHKTAFWLVCAAALAGVTGYGLLSANQAASDAESAKIFANVPAYDGSTSGQGAVNDALSRETLYHVIGYLALVLVACCLVAAALVEYQRRHPACLSCRKRIDTRAAVCRYCRASVTASGRDAG
jgi:hypothetical protein